MHSKPFEIEITRGPQTESCHLVHAVVYDNSDSPLEIYGERDFPVFPRSSLKPIQALPLILTGAAQHFNVTNEEIALACASHRGELIHINPIKRWLHRMGLAETHLLCGTHSPANQEALFQLLREQGQPSALHNNCSGKHTGMLCTALHLGEDTKNYVTQNHPVQLRILQQIEEFCEFSLTSKSLGIDGCSIPAPCLPLEKLARGFAEFANPQRVSESTSEACRQVFHACVNHPLLTAGTGHFCSELMKETQGQVLIKGGAEGVVIAAVPSLKMGIALKTSDGNSRASELCLAILLHRLGLLSSESAFLSPKIVNWNKIETGLIRLKQ